MKALRLTKGAEYDDFINPFPKGCLRYDRFERHYKREQKKWVEADREFASLAEVYGEFRPDHF